MFSHIILLYIYVNKILKTNLLKSFDSVTRAGTILLVMSTSDKYGIMDDSSLVTAKRTVSFWLITPIKLVN